MASALGGQDASYDLLPHPKHVELAWRLILPNSARSNLAANLLAYLPTRLLSLQTLEATWAC